MFIYVGAILYCRGKPKKPQSERAKLAIQPVYARTANMGSGGKYEASALKLIY